MAIETRAEIIHCLTSTAGHIHGIVRMVEEDGCCIDVIKQIQATQTALGRVSETLLHEHLRDCVTVVIQDGDLHAREQMLAEIIQVLRHCNRSGLGPGD